MNHEATSKLELNKKEFLDYSKIFPGYNDILTPEDVQKILRIGRNTVYEYLSKGIIKSLKIGGKYRIPKLYLWNYIYQDRDLAERSA